MYKIILADDEPLILRGLKKMIDWERLNAKVEGTVTDGKQLLDLIRKSKPDIIISDIAMPNLSGLDVIKSIKENHWNIKVIFLSGYQEFNYAKQAITYGAVDYLLKPASKSELEQALATAEGQLTKEKPAEFWNEENRLLNFIQDSNVSGNTELKEELSTIKNDSVQRSFVCVFFSLSFHSKRVSPDPNKLAIIQFSVFQFIQNYLKTDNLGIVLKRHENRYDTVFTLPPENPLPSVKKNVAAIQNSVRQNYNMDLLIGIGDIVDSISDLKYAYKTARFAFKLNYFQPAPVTYYEDASKEFHQSFEDYNTSYKAFFQSVLHKENQWRERLEDCLNIIESLHFGNRYAAEDRCIAMAIVFYKELKEYKLIDEDEKKQAEYENKVGNLRNQDTYGELKSKLTGLFQQLVDLVYQNKNSESLIVYQVKEYINCHFSEEITLEEIAKQVYMNPYYFSTFFKRKTGENFKNYLTKVRMKQAFIILKRKDVKTSELAQAVGYKDVRTFTDKFKETYGDSPAGLKKQGNL